MILVPAVTRQQCNAHLPLLGVLRFPGVQQAVVIARVLDVPQVDVCVGGGEDPLQRLAPGQLVLGDNQAPHVVRQQVVQYGVHVLLPELDAAVGVLIVLAHLLRRQAGGEDALVVAQRAAQVQLLQDLGLLVFVQLRRHLIQRSIEHGLDEGPLHMQVQWQLGVQRGRYIDLQQPGHQVLVQQHIEAEELEAIVAEVHILAVHAIQPRLPAHDPLDHKIAQRGPQALGVHAAVLQAGPQRLQRPLVSLAGIEVLVLGIVLRELVDAVVGQVHAALVQVAQLRTVLHGRESRQPVLVHVDPERVDRGQHHIQAHVELVVVDQQRSLNVPASEGEIELGIGFLEELLDPLLHN